MAIQAESRFAIIAAIIGNLIIAAIKFIAAISTGSSAMISEGIHSIVDTGNGSLLLLGIKQSKKPADREHPFGHGKALYFWTLIVSVSIFGIGGGMSLYEGISHIRHVAPEIVISDPTANYIVLALAFIVESTSFSIAFRKFRKAKHKQSSLQYIKSSKDPSMYTIVFEDSAAIVGLIFAFLGVFFSHLLKNPYLDGTASLLIGILLMSVAFVLAFETRGLLLGEGVNAKTLADIRQRIESDPAVERAKEILTMYMGPNDLLLNIGVVFKYDVTADQIREAINRIEKNIRSAYPESIRIFIETESLSTKK